MSPLQDVYAETIARLVCRYFGIEPIDEEGENWLAFYEHAKEFLDKTQRDFMQQPAGD